MVKKVHLILAVIVIALLALPITAQAAPFPVRDEGFEQDGFDWGTGWGNYGWGPTGARSNDPDQTAITHGGSQALAVSLTPAINNYPGEVVIQEHLVDFPSGYYMTLSSYLNITSAVNGETKLQMIFKDAPGAGGTELAVYQQLYNTATSGWEAVSISGDVPTGAQAVSFGLVTSAGRWDQASNFAVYMDDVSAEVVPEPSSLLLLGSGLIGLLGIAKRKKVI